MDSEELRTYKTKLLQGVQESYIRHCDEFVREKSSPHLHYRIAQLQAELSRVYGSLKEQQTELASLRSAHGKQNLGACDKPNDLDTESDSDLRYIPKRRRLSRRSAHFGIDGVDEHTMDGPGREKNTTSSWLDDVSFSSQSRSQQRLSAPYLSRDQHSARSSHRSGRKFHRGAIDTRSTRGSTLTEFGHHHRAAYGSSNHSGLDGILMPPPSQPRLHAPGLAKRKAKVDEYDPLGRLIPKDFYPLRKEKEDAAVTGTWTTIDPDDNLRSWDTLKKQERSQSDSHGSPSMSQTSTVESHKELQDRRNSSSVAASNEDTTNLGWATSHYDPEKLVDSRFEDPELDVDPEVRVSNRTLSSIFGPSLTLFSLS